MRGNRRQKPGFLTGVRNSGLHGSSGEQNAWFVPNRLLCSQWICRRRDHGPSAKL